METLIWRTKCKSKPSGRFSRFWGGKVLGNHVINPEWKGNAPWGIQHWSLHHYDFCTRIPFYFIVSMTVPTAREAGRASIWPFLTPVGKHNLAQIPQCIKRSDARWPKWTQSMWPQAKIYCLQSFMKVWVILFMSRRWCTSLLRVYDSITKGLKYLWQRNIQILLIYKLSY